MCALAVGKAWFIHTNIHSLILVQSICDKAASIHIDDIHIRNGVEFDSRFCCCLINIFCLIKYCAEYDSILNEGVATRIFLLFMIYKSVQISCNL